MTRLYSLSDGWKIWSRIAENRSKSRCVIAVMGTRTVSTRPSKWPQLKIKHSNFPTLNWRIWKIHASLSSYCQRTKDCLPILRKSRRRTRRVGTRLCATAFRCSGTPRGNWYRHRTIRGGSCCGRPLNRSFRRTISIKAKQSRWWIYSSKKRVQLTRRLRFLLFPTASSTRSCQKIVESYKACVCN